MPAAYLFPKYANKLPSRWPIVVDLQPQQVYRSGSIRRKSAVAMSATGPSARDTVAPPAANGMNQLRYSLLSFVGSFIDRISVVESYTRFVLSRPFIRPHFNLASVKKRLCSTSAGITDAGSLHNKMRMFQIVLGKHRCK